jgi:hypothetical protein
MAGVQNLAVIDDAAGTTYGFGNKAFEADGNYLCSIIATNMSAL